MQANYNKDNSFLLKLIVFMNYEYRNICIPLPNCRFNLLQAKTNKIRIKMVIFALKYYDQTTLNICGEHVISFDIKIAV